MLFVGESNSKVHSNRRNIPRNKQAPANEHRAQKSIKIERPDRKQARQEKPAPRQDRGPHQDKAPRQDRPRIEITRTPKEVDAETAIANGLQKRINTLESTISRLESLSLDIQQAKKECDTKISIARANLDKLLQRRSELQQELNKINAELREKETRFNDLNQNKAEKIKSFAAKLN